MDISEFVRRDWTQASGDETLRIAVVGYGSYAENFARSAIRRAELVELSVVVSDSRSTVPEDGVRCIDYESYRDGTASGEYDAVYVCTPNAVHARNVETAAELGKAVLVEKPMGSTPEECECMVEVCDDADVPLMVGYRTRLDPVVRGVRRLVAEGGIGTPRLVESSFSFSLDPDDAGWRLDRDLAGGGALLDVGVYPINAVRYLLDDEPVSVTATTRTPGSPFDAVERDAHLQLEFEDCLASVSASYDAEFDSNLRIVGTEGVLELTPAYTSASDRTVVLSRGDDRTSWSPSRTSELTETFAYFASRVLGDRPVGPDGRDGHADLRIVEGAYESAETGSAVDLSEYGF